MRDLPASKIMTRPLFTAAPGDTLSSALALMEREGVHHLLVMDQGKIAGILSSSDLLKLAFLKRAEESPAAAGESLGLRVRDVMQSRVAVMRENASLRDVARALTLGSFHALPVLAIDDTPVGIVTSTDLVGLLLDQIDQGSAGDETGAARSEAAETAELRRLKEVLRAAEVFLNSGQSARQHAVLTQAIGRAREVSGTNQA